MSAETITELLHASPFRPFVVHVPGAADVEVPHSDFAMLTKGGRVLLVNTEGDRVRHISMALISGITTTEDAGV